MIDRIDQRCDLVCRPTERPSDKESLLYCSGSLAAGPRHRPGAADYAAPRTRDRAASRKPLWHDQPDANGAAVPGNDVSLSASSGELPTSL